MSLTDLAPAFQQVLTDEELLERFQPVFDEIASGAVQREAQRALAFDAIERLKAAGFGALRVPTRFGGLGATLSQSIRLLARLGEADSNLVQALRAHFATIESLLLSDDTQQGLWFPRIVGGALIGNATTERGNAPGWNSTVLTQRDGRLLLNGTKYYSTGSLYADWIKVHADTEDGGSVRVAVHRDAAGLELVDDWDGFGQRLTASGTTLLTDVEVQAEDVTPYSREFGTSPLTAYVQLILLTALTGIGRAARRDVVEYVRSRERAFSHGVGSVPRRDPLVQEVVGRVAATVFGVEAALDAAAAAVEDAARLAAHGDLTVEQVAALDTRIAEAQILIAEQVLDATNRIFEVGGASAASESRRLDRHWRNARVIAQHNPLIYRAREIGQQHLTGDFTTTPVYVGRTNNSDLATSQEATA